MKNDILNFIENIRNIYKEYNMESYYINSIKALTNEELKDKCTSVKNFALKKANMDAIKQQKRNEKAFRAMGVVYRTLSNKNHDKKIKSTEKHQQICNYVGREKIDYFA